MSHPKGSCLCGAVAFEVSCDLPKADACHCTRCRRLSGHYWASVDLPRDAVTLSGEENITWFFTADDVRRGFCATCGSALFWDPIKRDIFAIALGAFDEPTNTEIGIHVYVANKGDYYQITDDLPQRQ